MYVLRLEFSVFRSLHYTPWQAYSPIILNHRIFITLQFSVVMTYAAVMVNTYYIFKNPLP